MYSPGDQYSGRDVPQMESIIDERLVEWTKYIDRHWTSSSRNTKVFDIARSIQYLTTDIICHLCFGTPEGFVAKHEEIHEFLGTLESRLPIAEQFSVFTELFTLLATVTKLPAIKRMLIPQNTDTFGVGKILGVCNSTCLCLSTKSHHLADLPPGNRRSSRKRPQRPETRYSHLFPPPRDALHASRVRNHRLPICRHRHHSDRHASHSPLHPHKSSSLSPPVQ